MSERAIQKVLNSVAPREEELPAVFDLAEAYPFGKKVTDSDEDAINTGVITSRMKVLTQAQPMSILVVDDDEIERALIGDPLVARGFDVVRAKDGHEALALMGKRYFPVLVTDWLMPGMDGIELAEHVRARGMSETYIVMLTAKDSKIDYERGYAAGVDDFLSKKVPEIELHARINAALSTAALRVTLKEACAALVASEKRNPLNSLEAAPQLSTVAEPEAGHSHATSEDIGTTTQTLALTMMSTPKVLIVDDDEIILQRLKMPIVETGYEVHTATNAAAALAMLKQDFMSIVILDRSMPGMDGLQLCRAIREQTWPGYVYILLLTAHDAEKDVLLGLEAGADDYLSKRVSDAQIIGRLNAATRVLSLEHSLKSAIEDRRRMAMTDPLTGAHNRRYFDRYLRGELKRARRFRTEVSLLVLDVDHFKRVNDTHGHAAGDLVLQELVKRIKKCLPREYDWCARLGGEEFAVVLPQTDLAGAAVVAEKLRKAVEAMPLHLGAGTSFITVSIGVSGLQAMPKRDTATVAMLLDHADQYLYKSKDAGRNRVSQPEPNASTR
ncbi:MAG: two-component system, cell cycle response regulator [Gammaproteobacteria bacterium]|jgi:two-component system cell cycle response regulator|nr:two-component system, cell cycle response regulator [Gammaproteobacteria bacterium]